ncbi:MAG TPA: TVP38/TMEM64 family protein [Methylomirabilota bacterium]|nr:TVP38/TMEM64 family protein [Methylomirabilota bacterium]
MKLILLIVAVVALLVLARVFDAGTWLAAALTWIRGLGPVAPLVFLGLYVVACVLLLPGSVLTLGAGAVFGVAKAFVIVWISATLGATAAFLVGRYLVRDWVARTIAANPKLQALDATVTREGWKIVALMRLSPVIPFNLLNYAFGATRVSMRDYVLASAVGMLPGTAMYVYLGSVAGELAAGSARARTPLEWAFYGVGLIATVTVTVYLTRVARASLARRAAA